MSVGPNTRAPGKVAELKLERDPDLMYFIRSGDVWAVSRKQRGAPPVQISHVGVPMEDGYIYYLDRDGDIARTPRQT